MSLQESGADPAQTLAALLVAWQIDPGHYGINHRLGQLYADQGQHEQALDHFRRALAARPDDSQTRLDVVSLEVRLGQFDAALADLPPLEPDAHLRGEAHYLKAILLDQRGERDAALALVQDVAGLTPAEAYRCESLHGRFLFEAGDFAGAQTRFRAALAGRPDYKEALRGLADSCRRLGDDAQAARCDEVSALFLELTDNVFIRSPQGRAQRREVLEKLLAAYPDWKEGFPKLADLQVELGDRDAACRTIEAFLAAHGASLKPDAVASLRRHYCDEAAR